MADEKKLDETPIFIVDGQRVDPFGKEIAAVETEADLMKLTKAELLERAGDSVTEDNNKSEIVAKLLSK